MNFHVTKGKLAAIFTAMLISASPALAIGETFFQNLVPDSIQKVMGTVQIFLLDFLAFVIDIFTVLLFVLWIALIFLIVYSIWWVGGVPKRFGARNFQDLTAQFAKRIWGIMK